VSVGLDIKRWRYWKIPVIALFSEKKKKEECGTGHAF